jgi:hypothetical protein
VIRVAFTALLTTLGSLCWVVAIGQAALFVHLATARNLPVWLVDWHVYAAGAADLVERTLYRTVLTYPPHPLPVSEFNLPPMAAALAVPFRLLPDPIAGATWAGTGAVASLAATWWLVYRCLKLPHGWVWIGGVLAIYAQSRTFEIHVLVGNINDLMLGMVALFTILYAQDRRTVAGVVLGIAAATKLWPAMVLIPLARMGRWREVVSALTTVAVLTTAFIVWLGPSVLPDMVAAISTTKVHVTPDNPVLWVAWLREHTNWWPDWGAFVVALGLLAIPARGVAAIGLGMLAGLTLIPNLWGHYFPTLAFSFGLIASGVARTAPAQALRRRLGVAWARAAEGLAAGS